ncbi:hypothetical protein [Streptomyces sp. NPDC015345]|uniref:hypothetical protein n=1 Tax=Streptomyces sp. NPDC015345 TaxID=3364953 RepID=UPI0037013A0B
MFEGYAGTSASGFRAEVESEQALARGETYITMIDAHERIDLTGPSAEEVARRLDEFGERAQFQGQIALDEHRLKRIMKRHDPAIYPGEYITCVHDPKVLCEKAKRGRSEGLPSHGGCKPLSCRNVSLTPENVTAWTRELARLEKKDGHSPGHASPLVASPPGTSRRDHRVPRQQRANGGALMTIRVSDLPEALARKRMNEMLEICQQTNTKPSVLRLARRLGLSNTTFRRRFPDIARELGALRSASVIPADGPSEHDRLIARNAKLRRRNQELVSRLALAVAQLQHLAMTNERLREALENASKITSIHGKRPPR